MEVWELSEDSMESCGECLIRRRLRLELEAALLRSSVCDACLLQSSR